MGPWPYGLLGLLVGVQLQACGAQPATTCGVPGISPHPEVGGQLVYSCDSGPAVKGELYLLDLSSGKVRRLTSGGGLNWDGDWSPDGRRIVFQSTRGGRYDLYVMDLETHSVQWLTGGAGFNDLPEWSPDGAWISFESSRDGISGPLGAWGMHRNIFMVRPDGSGLRRLTDGSAFNGSPAWSPAGDRLAFTSDQGGSLDIYVMDTDGHLLRQLTRHHGGRGYASWAGWSPDGSELVVDATNPPRDAAPVSVYRVPSTGGGAVRVTHGLDFQPNWSRDGDWIAFVRVRNAHTQLFIVRPDGSDLIQLTRDAGDKDWPRWRPT
jgi:TolB protein